MNSLFGRGIELSGNISLQEPYSDYLTRGFGWGPMTSGLYESRELATHQIGVVTKMTREFEFVTSAAFIGAGATLPMDLWGAFRRRFFSIRPLDLKLLGRWFGYMPRGRFIHDDITRAEPVKGEAVIGWVAHYGIGCAFAALLLAICGLDWTSRPTPLPALLVGLGTVAAPFFFMQPGFGAGIAGSRTQDPGLVRVRSVLTHVVYGVGLYASALVWAALSNGEGGKG